MLPMWSAIIERLEMSNYFVFDAVKIVWALLIIIFLFRIDTTLCKILEILLSKK